MGGGVGSAAAAAAWLAGCSAAAGQPTIRQPIRSRVAGGLGGWALGGRALELPDGLAFPCRRDPI